MAARPRTRTKREDRDRRPKKKISILDQESVEWIDYKDVNLLRRFMSERAKIRARRVTGNDAQQQRAVAKAIRVAREMALLPYSVRQVTHRSKGKRGDRDGGTLREFQPRADSIETIEAPDHDADLAAPDVLLDAGADDVFGDDVDAPELDAELVPVPEDSVELAPESEDES
jgi:small subunit ribosomal protein S18